MRINLALILSIIVAVGIVALVFTAFQISSEKQKLNKQKNLLIHDHNIKIKKFQKGFPIHTIQKIKKF